MKRTAPSPKRRGLFRHEPRQLNPQLSNLCPEVINVSPPSARSMIDRINSEHADRYLAFQSASDQLELLRLEALRLRILESTKSTTDPANEMSPHRASPVSTQGLSSNGEPGPTVPNSTRTTPNSMRTSMRPRASVLSESEISVLDLGPSLQSTHISSRASRRNSSSSSAHPGIGLARTTAPSFVPGPGSDTSDQQVERHLRTDELESVALTSASGSVNNDFPLNLRQRRQNRANITLPSPQELRPHRVNRSFTISGAHGSRDGSGFDQSPTSFTDEPNRRIFSLSVPQSPQSPALPPHPTLRRAQSSFSGMDPAFSAMRNAERAIQNARDAAGSRHADRK
ncbi:hypothetical protein N7471_005365 [Penicillium samsonianum]|uniref:uncharacterized protein n=1 Tax=Penicillium samsonianum TaxID=1882272 RepID=UPI002548DAEC|nr:uncharacterized protein N7471_005365 [Penicillium samsonianum]KAJ6138879.1 hypothetical protein N7471_005365 [Penicillium samsonianum]